MSRSKQRSLWYVTHLLWSCTHIPNIIDQSRKTKNVMARTRKYYLKNNYLTSRSKVKIQQRSLWYATHHLMDMHPHTKYHWPISKETIIWPWGQRTSSHEVHYGMWHTALWSYTHIPNIIELSQDKNVMVQTKKLYLKNHYLTLMSKFMVPGRSLWYTTHRLVVMHPYQISLTYLKRNNYLTFRSKVKVQQRSLWYATHRLMVMHPHTKYHWPRKKQLFDLEVKGQGPNKGHYGTQHTSYGHAPTYQISLTYLERNHYLTLRSKIKIPGRSLWFKTHRLMDMHPC